MSLGDTANYYTIYGFYATVTLGIVAWIYAHLTYLNSKSKAAETVAPSAREKLPLRFYVASVIAGFLLYVPPLVIARNAGAQGSPGIEGKIGPSGERGKAGPQGPPGAAAQFPPEAHAEIERLQKRVDSLSEIVKLEVCAQNLPTVSGSVRERTVRDSAAATALTGSPPSRGLGPPDVTTILASAFKQAETCLGAQRVPQPQPVPDDAADVHVSDEPSEPDAARRYRRVVARQKQAEAWLSAVRQTISERRQEVMNGFVK